MKTLLLIVSFCVSLSSLAQSKKLPVSKTKEIILDSTVWAELEDAIQQTSWMTIGTSSSGDKFLLNRKYMSNETEDGKDVVKCWVKVEFVAYKYKNVAYPKAYSQQLMYVDCDSKKIKKTARHIYKQNGTVIASYPSTGYEEWEEPAPETVAEIIVSEACSMITTKKI